MRSILCQLFFEFLSPDEGRNLKTYQGIDALRHLQHNVERVFARKVDFGCPVAGMSTAVADLTQNGRDLIFRAGKLQSIDFSSQLGVVVVVGNVFEFCHIVGESFHAHAQQGACRSGGGHGNSLSLFERLADRCRHVLAGLYQRWSRENYLFFFPKDDFSAMHTSADCVALNFFGVREGQLVDRKSVVELKFAGVKRP